MEFRTKATEHQWDCFQKSNYHVYFTREMPSKMLFSSWEVSICHGCKWINNIQVLFSSSFIKKCFTFLVDKYAFQVTLVYFILEGHWNWCYLNVYFIYCLCFSFSATALVIETMEASTVALKLYHIKVNPIWLTTRNQPFNLYRSIFC